MDIKIPRRIIDKALEKSSDAEKASFFTVRMPLDELIAYKEACKAFGIRPATLGRELIKEMTKEMEKRQKS